MPRKLSVDSSRISAPSCAVRDDDQRGEGVRQDLLERHAHRPRAERARRGDGLLLADDEHGRAQRARVHRPAPEREHGEQRPQAGAERGDHRDGEQQRGEGELGVDERA